MRSDAEGRMRGESESPGEGPTPEAPPPASEPKLELQCDDGTVEPPPSPLVVDVRDLDWDDVRRRADPAPVRARMREIVERAERMFAGPGGPRMLFDDGRESDGDRAIRVEALDDDAPLWFVGDLHGDLLGLEAALALVERGGIERDDGRHDAPPRPRIVFLGDLFDDGGSGLEVLLRVLELIADDPGRICFVAGNHDEALRWDGRAFRSTVSPSDFSDALNQHLDDEWVVRAGRLAIALAERAPRALFLPDGLLVAHGGVPLADLHAALAAGVSWNDPLCLQDFVWTRAHPRARRKIPNRSSRGSQFGHEDFASFCRVAAARGRPVERMVRGHDHVEDRWATYPAWEANPILTIVTLSRRLARESFGPFERAPCVARWVPGVLPSVHRLLIPAEMIHEAFAADVTESAVMVEAESGPPSTSPSTSPSTTPSTPDAAPAESLGEPLDDSARGPTPS